MNKKPLSRTPARNVRNDRNERPAAADARRTRSERPATRGSQPAQSRFAPAAAPVRGRSRQAPRLEEAPVAEIPDEMRVKTRRSAPTDLATKKSRVEAWVTENRIPGKVQAWLAIAPEATSGDWRLISETRGAHRMLMLEPPAPGIKPPPAILSMDDQLRKEHLKPLRRQLLQVIFRATGDGRYGVLVHAILRTPEAARAFKAWLDWLQRFHPETVFCHLVQTKPWFPFDPSRPPAAMKYTLKSGFGSEYLPLASTGLHCHALDWTPRNKSTWLAWPERLRNAIHPVKGDKLLALYSGPGFEAFSLASAFAEAHCVDSRQWAHSSWMHNHHASGHANVQFHQEKLDEAWVQKFYAQPGRAGKWTILLDPPGDDLMLAGTIIALAATKPERVVHLVEDLDVAGKEIKRWRRHGYVLRKIVPIDWNPGTSRVGMAMIFVPDRAGLLGRKPELAARQTPARPREEPAKPAIRFVQQPRSRTRNGKG